MRAKGTKSADRAERGSRLKALLRPFQTFLLAGVIATASFYTWPPSQSGALAPLLKPLHNIERSGYDLLFAIRGARKDRIDDRIAIVGIDRNSETTIGQRWAFPRRYHANVIRNLAKDGAKLIVYDVLFSGSSSRDDDKALDAALKEAGNVILTCRFERSTSRRQITLESPYYSDALGIDFEAAAKIGFAEVPQDTDDVVRAFSPVMKFQDEWMPSLASAAYMRLNDIEESAIKVTSTEVRLGDRSIPRTGPTAIDQLDRKTEIPSALIDFPAGINAFPQPVPFEQLAEPNPTFKKGTFKDKIVFVGLTGYELVKEANDRYATAFTVSSPERSGSGVWTEIPGVVVQASALNSILTSGYIRPVPPPAFWLIVFVVSTAGLTAVRTLASFKGPLLFVALAAGYVGFAVYLFSAHRMHLPYFAPLVLLLIPTGAVGWFERGAIKRRWSTYVSPKVLEHILRSGEEHGAKRYEASVMFADIRGFTAFSDSREPELVVNVLNTHFERVIDLILENEGTVDKFMGDGLLCFFGVPLPVENTAFQAVRAAWMMCETNTQPLDYEGESYLLRTGIGIATGPFIAGHIGTRRRHDFTVIGDVVNTASRIQGLATEGGVVIDTATYEMVKDHAIVEAMGAIPLKGKAVPVPCFRVVDWSDAPRNPEIRNMELMGTTANA